MSNIIFYSPAALLAASYVLVSVGRGCDAVGNLFFR